MDFFKSALNAAFKAASLPPTFYDGEADALVEMVNQVHRMLKLTLPPACTALPLHSQ